MCCGRLATKLPIGVNPWSTLAAAVASVDYVKRPEVLPAVAACPWDIVVVDEAHGVAGDSDRHAAVHTLASRAAYVLLLTATPHSGDRRAFEALCELGAADSPDDPPLLVFRRTRHDVGTGTIRRVHMVRVRQSPDELRMHALLARYSDAVRGERGDDGRRDVCLALSVLHKRALSSAWSLAQSVERRLSSLAPSNAADRRISFRFRSAILTASSSPRTSLHHGRRICGCRILNGSGECSPRWPPSRARRRCASRSWPRSAVCFGARMNPPSCSPSTATRWCTSVSVCRSRRHPPALVILHGGLTREERAAALDEFGRARRALLLATDAAAEGLNLHRGCRLVVNLELPWNPMRLEQRIGRVDRIGQPRTVHAFHLIARGTGETRILSRLRARVAAAKADLGAPDPFGDDVERAIARLVVARELNDVVR